MNKENLDKIVEKLFDDEIRHLMVDNIDGEDVYNVKKAIKQAFSLHAVVASLPTKQEMWTKKEEEVKKIENSDSIFGKETISSLSIRLGFEKCYEWIKNKG